MTRTIKIAVAAALGLAVIAVAAYAATGSGDPAAKPTPDPTPNPKTKHLEDEWSVETPYGWKRVVITNDADAKKAVRYEGPNGEFFIVAIDPLGSGYSYDERWTYQIKGLGFVVTDKVKCKADCPSTDKRFDGTIIWKAGATPVKLAGHTWYFQFGNAKADTVDAKLFETILESVRVTP